MVFPDLHVLHQFELVVVQVHLALPALGVMAGDWLCARPYHPERPFVLQRPAEAEIVNALWRPECVTVLTAERRDPSQSHHLQRPYLMR